MATITMIPVVCACVVVVVVRDPHVDDDVGDDLPMAAVGGLCVWVCARVRPCFFMFRAEFVPCERAKEQGWNRWDV